MLSLALPNKPDFVELDTTNLWVVIESKGRSNGATNGLMQSAKLQTRSLRNVGGALPVLRAAVASYFSSQRLRARVRDPDEYDDNAPDVPLEAHELVREYYRPLVEFVNHSRHEPRLDTDTGRTYIRTEVPGFDAAVEIEDAVLRWCESPGEPLRELVPLLPQRLNVLEYLSVQRATNENARAELLTDPMRAKALGAERLRQEQPTSDDGVVVTLGNSWNADRMRREPEDRGA